MKFYKHDVNESRARDANIMRMAEKNIVTNGYPLLAEGQILRLQDVAKNGLPDCYGSFTDFMYDFYPNFSWNPRGFATEVNCVLADQRMVSVFEDIKNEWDFDLKADIIKAMEEE